MMKPPPILTEYLSGLDAEKALEEVQMRLRRGDDPQAVLSECRQGLEAVGRKFEIGRYFLAELMYGAKILQEIMEILKPELKKVMKSKGEGKIIIATVKDDIHDIGKNLVASMLQASGFEMIDLGVDVSSDSICTSIREQDPDIVALSCLLTSTIASVENTIVDIGKAGLRDRVKIIVGGNPLDPELAAAIGSDAYGDDAHQAVIKCRELSGV